MGGRAALMIIPDSSSVCFIFNLCQHCEAGQRDLTQHRFSAKRTKVFLFSLVFLTFIFLFWGVFWSLGFGKQIVFEAKEEKS